MDAQYTGKIIAEARKAKGLTQKDIAEAMHVSVAAVSKWERGLNFPDLSLVEALAAMLEISAARLLGIGENEPAEKVIKDVAQISSLSGKASQRETLRRMFIVAAAAAAFFAAIMIIGAVGVEGIPFFAEGVYLNLVPIVVGLAAWSFGIAAVMSEKWLKLSVLSFAFCSFALCFPIFLMDMEVRTGDWSAVEDTVWALDFASIALFLGTVILNICAYFVHRNKSS